MNILRSKNVFCIIAYAQEMMSVNLCPMRTFPYTLRPGDTLRQLAQRYNTTVHAIVISNPGINPGSLHAGQVICMRPGYGCTDEKEPANGSGENPQDKDNSTLPFKPKE